MRLDPPLILLKIQLVWIKDHNAKFETLNWLDRNREKAFEDRGMKIYFLTNIQLCSEIMPRIDKLDYMNLNVFYKPRKQCCKKKSSLLFMSFLL